MRGRLPSLVLLALVQAALASQDAGRLVWTIPAEAYFWGHVSPDGRLLAYGNRSDGEIYVQDLAAASSRRVTSGAKLGVDALEPELHGDDFWVFSSDGRQLAYSWQEGETESLRVVTLAETAVQPRVLVPSAGIRWISPLSWSHDHQWIAFTMTTRQSEDKRLCLVAAVGGDPRILDAAAEFGTAAFSPDGRHLVYSRAPDDRPLRDIYAVALDTGTTAPLIRDDADKWVIGWSPDGRTLLFRRNRDGASSIWEAPFANGEAGPARLLRAVSRDAEQMGFARSGSWFYRVYPRPSWKLRILEIDFMTGEVGISSPTTFTTPSAWFPASWSADARWLASVSSASPDGRRVAIHSKDGSELRQVKPALAAFETVAWSPDGQTFATIGNDPNRRRGLYRVDARAGDATLLAEGASLFRAWSPDGSKVYFDRVIADGSRDIEIVEKDVTSARERRVHRGASGVEANQTRVLAADGRLLYFLNPHKLNTGSHTLIAKDLATGQETVLLADRALGPIALSAAGSFVVTSSDGAPLLIPTGGGPPRPVPQIGGRTPAILAWGPDGRSVLARTATVDSASTSAYWWVPLDGAPRRLDLSLEPSAGILASAGSAIAVIERIGPVNPPAQLWALDLFESPRRPR
jgi:Tol biopolymer transport system component